MAGRLGDPSMTLSEEPRLHPDLLEAFRAQSILEQSFLTTAVTEESSLEQISEFMLNSEEQIERILDGMNYTVQDPTLVKSSLRTVEVIRGKDGNDIKLIFHQPEMELRSPIPAIVYFHGGGMVILNTENAQHATWADALARTGALVVSVDFRNALSRSGRNPYPAGLDDCAEAVKWLHKNKDRLRITKIVLQGDSGGANLAIATTLKAKKEGWIDAIEGVYAMSPYISGAYGLPDQWKQEHLPSLIECDGYAVSVALASLNARLYDPCGKHRTDPLAWPFWASKEDLIGLPPHFIVINELDPYRDEGRAFYQNLASAGVRVGCRSNLGVTHAAELAFREVIPDIFLANLWECKKFSDRV